VRLLIYWLFACVRSSEKCIASLQSHTSVGVTACSCKNKIAIYAIKSVPGRNSCENSLKLTLKLKSENLPNTENPDVLVIAHTCDLNRDPNSPPYQPHSFQKTYQIIQFASTIPPPIPIPIAFSALLLPPLPLRGPAVRIGGGASLRGSWGLS